ncbi:beta-ketoacyl synthase chain length factor [Thalassotalea litorea]|uniref:beta-ketoacyl synthase chain length factor n=1 Tax=Thalassotalea litorea TaxID=2020715 RepID=UPI003735699B
MHILIENLSYLLPTHVVLEEKLTSTRHELSKDQLPTLDWVPKIQRRRLSKFMKMALACAYEASITEDGLVKPMQSVFTSRHGDLHKTSNLLLDLSEQEPLSPTAFSLSVHNAVAGLFTIFTANADASTTISAGANTLLMGLMDAYARIKSGMAEEMLFVHCDQVLPSIYEQYKDEIQVDHALAFRMRVADNMSSGKGISLDELQGALSQESKLPQAIQFLGCLKRNRTSIFSAQGPLE